MKINFCIAKCLFIVSFQPKNMKLNYLFFLILSFPTMVLSECKELNGCITEFNELNTGDTSINSKLIDENYSTWVILDHSLTYIKN